MWTPFYALFAERGCPPNRVKPTRLPSCSSVADVQGVVYDVLLKMFDEETVKAPNRLERIAGLIWMEASAVSGVRRPTSR